jgi:hypothetical protein
MTLATAQARTAKTAWRERIGIGIFGAAGLTMAL